MPALDRLGTEVLSFPHRLAALWDSMRGSRPPLFIEKEERQVQKKKDIVDQKRKSRIARAIACAPQGGCFPIKRSVYVTRSLFPDILEPLERKFAVEVWTGAQPVPRGVFVEKVSAAEGILTMLTDKVDSDLLDSAPLLKAVANMAVGYDNINIDECTRRGILVTNTPDVLTETTADLAFGLILAVARRIGEAERFLRAGRWDTWDPLLMVGTDVHGATLGIVGMGRIGRALARRARGFDMEVIYYSRTAKSDDPKVRWVPLDLLLKESDLVSLHLPLSEQTVGVIGEREIALMKPTAILINTARGALIDEDALFQALASGRIGGAGLDVYRNEPISPASPLLQLENVVLLPHIGSASLSTRRLMAATAVRCLTAALSDGDVPNLVNAQALSALGYPNRAPGQR